MTKEQMKVFRRMTKYLRRKDRRELARHLIWYRKNKKPLEF